MSNRILFTIAFLVWVACAVGIGVTGDMHLKHTSDALTGIVGVLGPVLVLWFFFGAMED